MEISSSEIPYLKDHPNDGRIRPVMNFYDHSTKEWNIYQIKDKSKILRIVPVDCSSGTFLSSKIPDCTRDIEIPLLTFLLQHFPSKELFDAFDRLRSDLENSLSNIEKQKILFCHYSDMRDMSYLEVLRTEIEYALFNLRSFYDLLNRFVITFIGNHTDGNNNIPDSFRRVAGRSESELIEKYNFSTVLARFYKNKESVFTDYRDLRDDIGHHGHSPETIYKLDNGFGIASHTRFGQKLKRYGIFEQLSPRENGVTSLLGFIALITDEMFSTLSEFTEAFIESFNELPEETAPGYSVFARMRLVYHYHSLQEILENPWNQKFYNEATT